MTETENTPELQRLLYAKFVECYYNWIGTPDSRPFERHTAWTEYVVARDAWEEAHGIETRRAPLRLIIH